MIVRMTQWQPRHGLAREDALRAWERHAHLVERLPGLRRYVQDHAVTAPDGSDPPFAGLGEAWFDDAMSARTALETPEWAATIEDAKQVHGFRVRHLQLGPSHALFASPSSLMPTALDNGRRSPKALLRAIVARLLGLR